MDERRREHRSRTLRSGKIVFNSRQSVIDCIVRNLSDTGACLQINNTTSLPPSFELALDGERTSRHCQVIWRSETRTGIEFLEADTGRHPGDAGAADGAQTPQHADARGGAERLRSELLMLRAALDEVPVGIVLLDANTRALFISRAFRRMWRLPDAKVDSRPPFVALMYHGRDTNAYEIPPDELDDYVAERVALVEAGDPRPLDLRLTNGEMLRLTCTVLPSGGRMLCYTYVTDIVRHSDELEMLRGALDQMQPGIILLDQSLSAQFMNRAVRSLWQVSDAQADSRPPYAELVGDSRRTGAYGVPADELDDYIARRIAAVRAGDATPIDIPYGDGRTIRAQCAPLPAGGRMITYNDVTDLVHRANEFEQLATHDGMTGLCNRRQFDVLADAEWSRFQRYHRPLSLLLVDIDCFKQINDRLGHAAGDAALRQIAAICTDGKRSSDIVARIGGDEFAALLPEADFAQAHVVAERLRQAILRQLPGTAAGGDVAITVSIGIAAATASMSGVGALMRLADKALYDAKAAGRNCIRSAEEPVVPARDLAAE